MVFLMCSINTNSNNGSPYDVSIKLYQNGQLTDYERAACQVSSCGSIPDIRIINTIVITPPDPSSVYNFKIEGNQTGRLIAYKL